MKRLPFLLPSDKAHTVTVGGERWGGTFEVRVHGYLLAGEHHLIDESSYSSTVYLSASKLGASIAASEGVEPKQGYKLAYEVLSTQLQPGQMTNQQASLLRRHGEAIGDLLHDINNSHEELRNRMALAVITYRVPGCEDWNLEDVKGLPLEIRDQFADLAERERRHDPIADEEGEPEPVEETVGKSQEASGSLPLLTGPASTGSAKSTGRRTSNSRRKDSPAAPAGT